MRHLKLFPKYNQKTFTTRYRINYIEFNLFLRKNDNKTNN